jgi:hypothetical protein
MVVKYIVTLDDDENVGRVGWHLAYSLVRESKGRTTYNIQSWME